MNLKGPASLVRHLLRTAEAILAHSHPGVHHLCWARCLSAAGSADTHHLSLDAGGKLWSVCLWICSSESTFHEMNHISIFSCTKKTALSSPLTRIQGSMSSTMGNFCLTEMTLDVLLLCKVPIAILLSQTITTSHLGQNSFLWADINSSIGVCWGVSPSYSDDPDTHKGSKASPSDTQRI